MKRRLVAVWHHSSAVMVTGGAMIVSSSIGSIIWPHDGMLKRVVLGVSLGCGLFLAGLSVVLDVLHAGVPCPLCAKELPLNATQVAERRRRTLRVFHFYTDGSRPRSRSWVVATLLPPPALCVGVGALAYGVRGAMWGAVAGCVAVYVLALHLVSAVNVHRRLQLWCPYCQHGVPEPRVHAD